MSSTNANDARGGEAVDLFVDQLGAFLDHWIGQLPDCPVRERCGGLLLELLDIPPKPDAPRPKKQVPLKLFPLAGESTASPRQTADSGTPADSLGPAMAALLAPPAHRESGHGFPSDAEIGKAVASVKRHARGRASDSTARASVLPPMRPPAIPAEQVRRISELVRTISDAGYRVEGDAVPKDRQDHTADIAADRAVAREQDCPGCQRHGMEFRAFWHPDQPGYRGMAFCRRCSAAVEI